jgi:hypothetical protein
VVERNRRNHAAYAKELADVPGMHLLQYPDTEKGNWRCTLIDAHQKRLRVYVEPRTIAGLTKP